MQQLTDYLDTVIWLSIDTYKQWNYPVGSMLLVDSCISLEWKNQVVTKGDASWHAEIDIVRKSEIYRGRGHKKQLFVTMEPCNNCAKALCDYGVDEVYYVLEDPSWWGKALLEKAWIQVTQVKHRYDEYLDTMIEFMRKNGGYNEVLVQYLSLKENGKNVYRDSLDVRIANTFLNIEENTPDYSIRKIVYNNTISYLTNALLRTEESKHHIIFDGYTADTERIIAFCRNSMESGDQNLSKSFICGLHKTLYPAWYVQKSRDAAGREFVSMVPGEYRNIPIESRDNADKNIYADPLKVREEMSRIIRMYNDRTPENTRETILYFFALFSRVHPFGDWNGRTIDILVDILLLKNNLEPLYSGKIKRNDAVGFYKILDEIYEKRIFSSFWAFLEKYTE